MGTKQPSKYICCSVGNAFLQPIQKTYKEADPGSKASSDKSANETAFITPIEHPLGNVGNSQHYCIQYSVGTIQFKSFCYLKHQSLYYGLEPAVDTAQQYRVIDALRRSYGISISVRYVFISSFGSPFVCPQQDSFVNSIISTLSYAVQLSHIRMPRF